MFPFTLQQLRILKAIATEKNFTKAADVLYLSQPSLSKQIKKLEQNLNVLLIHRENNQIFLTENGEILLRYSEKILPLCEECCRILMDLKNGERGNLTIGANARVGSYLLPKILKLFVKNYPEMNLKINLNSTPIIIQNIKNKNLDIGMVDKKILNNFRKYILIEPFLKDNINLITTKFYFFGSKKILSKKDLYNLNLITLNSSSTFQKLINNTLIQKQIEINRLKIILEFNSVEKIKTAIKLGLGVAFLFSSTLEKEMKLKTIEILKIKDINLSRPLFILKNSKTLKTKTFDSFSIKLWKLKNNLKN